MKSFSLYNSYEVRLLALAAILAAYYWPDSWFWCLVGFLLAWLILELYCAFGSDLRYYKRGPRELAELSFHRILLHGFSLAAFLVFWIERQAIGYLPGVVTVVAIAICLSLVAIGLFGAEQLDDLADKTN